MEDSHLLNTIKMLKRFAINKLIETRARYLLHPEPHGDGALMAFEREFDYWCGDNEDSAEWLDLVPGIFENMILDARRRNIDISFIWREKGDKRHE